MYGVQVGMRARGARGRFGLFFVAIAVLGLFGGAASWANERGGVSPQTARLPPAVEAAQVGTASWYGAWHHGRLTANGERFDMYAMTAAHKSLPLGTNVRVTNLANQKSVLLRVNDRGPFVHGRVLDVSYGAARKLGFAHDGLAPVRIAVLPPRVPVPHSPVRVIAGYPKDKPVPQRGPAGRDGWLVQIAAVWSQSDIDGEWQRLSQRHGSVLKHHTPRIQHGDFNGRDVYRLRIGRFAGRQSASVVCEMLQARGQDCFVVASGPAGS